MKSKITYKFEQYQSNVHAVLNEMSKYSEDQFHLRKNSDTWSIQQHLLHLVMAEELSLSYVRKKMVFGGAFDTAGLASSFRYFQLYMAMLSPFKFKAPKAIDTENLPNNVTLAQIKTRWEENHTAWNNFFAILPDDLLDKAVYKHPRAGKISWINMISFFGVHLNRHRNQILAYRF
jgi:hypothetical protein